MKWLKRAGASFAVFLWFNIALVLWERWLGPVDADYLVLSSMIFISWLLTRDLFNDPKHTNL